MDYFSEFRSDVTTSYHLDAGHDAAEQQTEPYTEYGEGAAQAATKSSAKSASLLTGGAGKQTGTVEGVVEHTGFPNPATDSHMVSLDISKRLIKHPASTFFMRISGNEWEDRGIFDGDLIIIDRSLDPKITDSVIWWEGENFVISSYSVVPNSTPIWGVVVHVVHSMRSES